MITIISHTHKTTMAINKATQMINQCQISTTQVNIQQHKMELRIVRMSMSSRRRLIRKHYPNRLIQIIRNTIFKIKRTRCRFSISSQTMRVSSICGLLPCKTSRIRVSLWWLVRLRRPRWIRVDSRKANPIHPYQLPTIKNLVWIAEIGWIHWKAGPNVLLRIIVLVERIQTRYSLPKVKIHII